MALEPEFVRAEGTQFQVGERPFPVVGVNSYFLALLLGRQPRGRDYRRKTNGSQCHPGMGLPECR